MNSLVKIFRGFRTLLNKIGAVKRPETKKKYQDELKRKMDASLEKQRINTLLIQERRRRLEEKRFQKELNAAIKKQKKLERERKMLDSKFKGLKKKQELKSRLMTEEELNANFSRIDNGEYTNEEVNDFLKKYDAHSKEKIRRRNQLKKQGKEVRDKKKRTKLNRKFEYLNDILKKVRVEEGARTDGGQILEFDLTLKGYGHSFTPEEYLEIMRADTIDVWRGHNDGSRTKLILKFVVVRYSPTSSVPVERNENHIATSKMDLFSGTDLNELYNDKKAALLSSFAKFEMNVSGWVLESITKLIARIYRYTPLSNVNSEPQAPLNINDDDRAGNCSFDIGDYLRNKKAIIVPQNKKDDMYCGLWAFTIAKFKPEKDAGRITKRLIESRVRPLTLQGLISQWGKMI